MSLLVVLPPMPSYIHSFRQLLKTMEMRFIYEKRFCHLAPSYLYPLSATPSIQSKTFDSDCDSHNLGILRDNGLDILSLCVGIGIE